MKKGLMITKSRNRRGSTTNSELAKEWGLDFSIDDVRDKCRMFHRGSDKRSWLDTRHLLAFSKKLV